MKRTTISLLFLLFIVVNALAEVINITIKGTTDKASKEVIVFLTQLLRFILVFLANQRFVFLICFTVFYKF